MSENMSEFYNKLNSENMYDAWNKLQKTDYNIEICDNINFHRYRNCLGSKNTNLSEYLNIDIKLPWNIVYKIVYKNNDQLFLAGQAILEEHIDIFIDHMIRANVGLIIVIGQLNHYNIEKIYPYWENDIWLNKINNTIKILHYVDCNDHGTPSNKQEFLNMILDTIVWLNKNPNKSIATHCSAGVGRSGMFYASLIAILNLQNNIYPNIYDIVLNLRINRDIQTVQTYEQFKEIYNICKLYLQFV